MKLKVNKELLPIKAHYFFFMASKFFRALKRKKENKSLNHFLGLGPILPQINVFGRQLGISPSVMGTKVSFGAQKTSTH